jgi:hypothetical protein
LAPSVRVRPSINQALVLVALVLGLVLGATAVGLVWFVSGHAAAASELPQTDASTAAAAACATLATVPPPGSPAFADRSPQGVPAGVYRLTGAASLAEVAQTEDAHYKPLSDALAKVTRLLARTSDTVAPQAAQALTEARAACHGL